MSDEVVSRREYGSDQKAVWKEIARIRQILEGPPHPGLETRVVEFLTEFRTLEMERDKQHKANRYRLNAIIGILTALAGYLAFFHH